MESEAVSQDVDFDSCASTMLNATLTRCAPPLSSHSHLPEHFIIASPPPSTVSFPARLVSLDHSAQRSSRYHQFHRLNQVSTENTKVVRFATPLVEVREITRSFYNDERSDNGSQVPKSDLFYSKHDYMKFYVREKSRLAFIKLNKQICHEQERRLRNRQRAMPTHFIVLNYWNAIMTINELGSQVQQQKRMLGSHHLDKRPLQQCSLLHRRKRHKRCGLFHQDPTPQNGAPAIDVSTPSTPGTITPNHHMTQSRRRHDMSQRKNNPMVTRAPKRNTVVAAIA